MNVFVYRCDRVQAQEWQPDPKVGLGFDQYGVEYYVGGYSYRTGDYLVSIWPGDYIVYPDDAFSFVCPREAFQSLFVTEIS